MSIYKNIFKIEIDALAEAHYSSPKSLSELVKDLKAASVEDAADRWLAEKSGRKLFVETRLVEPRPDTDDQFRLIQSVRIEPRCGIIDEIIKSVIAVSEILLDEPVTFDFNDLTIAVRSADNMYGYELQYIDGDENRFAQLKENVVQRLGCVSPIKRVFFAHVDPPAP